MSIELINRITVKKDGVYLSSHSSNDTAPFHSWRCKGLSEIYAAEGQKGLDREVIRMLYEYAQLRGSHKSLDRYRYARDCSEADTIYKRYIDQIDDRYEVMGEADRKSIWHQPTERAIKVLNKIFEAGFTDDKDISTMTMDDILSMQGVTIADISIINDLQKSIKANKVISFLGGAE